MVKDPERSKELCKINYYKRKDEYKNRQLLNRYGISLQTYREMLEKQNNVCAICEAVCPTNRYLAVDHCHKSGKVRGLLCYQCNIGLGAFKDNPDVIQRAKDYTIANNWAYTH